MQFVIICRQWFNYFINYIFFICTWHIKEKSFLFSIFSGSRLNFPHTIASAFFAAIYKVFLLFLLIHSQEWIGCIFLVFFFNLSRGCWGTCFIKSISKLFFYVLVFLFSLSRGCSGTIFINSTSKSIVVFFLAEMLLLSAFLFKRLRGWKGTFLIYSP